MRTQCSGAAETPTLAGGVDRLSGERMGLSALMRRGSGAGPVGLVVPGCAPEACSCCCASVRWMLANFRCSDSTCGARLDISVRGCDDEPIVLMGGRAPAAALASGGCRKLALQRLHLHTMTLGMEQGETK